MNGFQYIGLDIHKRTINYCVKTADGKIVEEGRKVASKDKLKSWAEARRQPWVGAMEATLFTHWVYDVLRPYAAELKVANPLLLKAITAAKKKNDRVDARTLADLLRCDLLPECYTMPAELRDLRRVLRYRNFLVRHATSLQNRISGLLMESGESYNTRRLHGERYFQQLLEHIEVPSSVLEMLRLSRGALMVFSSMEKRLRRGLLQHPTLRERVERLRSIHGVGEVTALTWALEIGPPERFPCVARACSYCGLTAAQRASADKEYRGPISKQRNKHLQTILIEAAKLAPRYNPQLAAVHARELKRGDANRATLAVARKLVAYLLAVDRSQQPFQIREPEATVA
jgi:transposase